MKINMPIGEFASIVEEFKDVKLIPNKELDITDLGCKINTPSGMSAVNYIIKKEDLTGIALILETGAEIKCAKHHILRKNDIDIFASQLNIGDKIDTINGPVQIIGLNDLEDTTYYDIGINAPHLYYDDHGVIHHNTIITATLSLCCESLGRTIVIVPNKSLVMQTEEDYINLGLDVGVYFGDRKEYNRQHTICTWQSLNNLGKLSTDGTPEVTLQEFIKDVVCVMVDECHTIKGNALKDLLGGPFSKIPIRWGLTGTIPKDDAQSLSLICSIGPVIGQLKASELQDQGVLADCQINAYQMVDFVDYRDYQSELKYLLENEDRLDYFAQLITQVSQTGNTLVLIDRVAPGKRLLEKIPEAVFISGRDKAKDRKVQYAEFDNAEEEGEEHKIAIATYGVASTGINIVRVHNLILIEPGKSFVRVIQSIGRGLRKGFDKSKVEIYDVSSTCKFSKRHLAARKKFYAEAGYPYTTKKVNWQ